MNTMPRHERRSRTGSLPSNGTWTGAILSKTRPAIWMCRSTRHQDYPGWRQEAEQPDDSGHGHPLGHGDLRRSSRQHHARRDAHEVGALGPSTMRSGRLPKNAPSGTASRATDRAAPQLELLERIGGRCPPGGRSHLRFGHRQFGPAGHHGGWWHASWKGRSPGCAEPLDGKAGKIT